MNCLGELAGLAMEKLPHIEFALSFPNRAALVLWEAPPERGAEVDWREGIGTQAEGPAEFWSRQ
jgi:hypothetical protein